MALPPLHTRDQYTSVTLAAFTLSRPPPTSLAPSLNICTEKIYVEVSQYTYNLMLLFVLLTYSHLVSTSHQNVVLEIDFAGALWVRFPHFAILFLTQLFFRVTQIYSWCQTTSLSEPFISIAVSAVRRNMRPPFSPPDASP
jgi:hypothetical protein